jgi:dTDP-4-dehydrorhamnose reductase
MTEKILLTGGSGRLGTSLRELIPSIIAPTRCELDVTKPESICSTLKRYQPTLIVHAAAYTNVAQAEIDKELCWQVNVKGTRALVQAATDLKLIHISTDYVFSGTTGNYREDDVVGPVHNYYAESKLVAEELVRMHPNHIAVRTSFRPNAWPYSVAFSDLFTSQDYLDVIAPEIALLIANHAACSFDTIHIATERKSVFELAKRRSDTVLPGSKRDAKVKLPDDISLNIERWLAWKADRNRFSSATSLKTQLQA